MRMYKNFSHIYQALFKSWLCRGKSWSLMARNFSVDGETNMRQIGSTVMCGLIIQLQRCYQGLAEVISESFHGGGNVSRSDEKNYFFIKCYGFVSDHLESFPCNQIGWLAVKTDAVKGSGLYLLHTSPDDNRKQKDGKWVWKSRRVI